MSDARLDRPPSPDRLLALSEALGTRFLLFVDTEEEFDWSQPFRREASVTATEALPLAHDRFGEVGIRPTYLATFPVVDDAGAGAMLRGFRERGEAVIGAQLHPWVTPPFVEPLSRRNSFAGALGPGLERAKLARLTTRIAEAVGARPIVYRAGRYGVGPATARALAEEGYRLDVSVRPGFDYRTEGGPDFTRFGPQPFRAGPLAALPLGVAWTGAARSLAPGLFPVLSRLPRGEGLASRLGLLGRVPLTPEGTQPAEAVEAIDALLGAGVRLISLSFHSPSLVPGCTPYVRTPDDLAAFWRWWRVVLRALKVRGVTALGADELVQALEPALSGEEPVR